MLRAEARRAVVVAALAQREHDALHVRRVVAQVLPPLAARVARELVVHLGVVGGRVDVRHVAAEVEEVLVCACWVPVDLLPRVGWVVEWAADGVGDCLGEISVILERCQAEDCLELVDGGAVLRSDEGVDLVDDVVDAGDGVLWAQELGWVVPLRVVELCVNRSTAGNAAVEGLAIRRDCKR